MQNNKTATKIFVIVGSTRPGRIGHTIAKWYMRLAEKHYPNIQFELIDLAEWNLPILNEPIPARAHIYQHNHTKRWSAKMSEANGYVIVTPEYNHGYPASLKNALDYLYDEWNGKPVAFIGYSWGGGKRVIEQLGQVASQLGMIPVPRHMPIFLHAGMFDIRRQLTNPDGALVEYAEAALQITNNITDVFKEELQR